MMGLVEPGRARADVPPSSSCSSSLNARVARALEHGSSPDSWRSHLAAWYGHFASKSISVPLRLPPGARVIGVGGAVLGGAGKTPIAIELARTLHLAGEHVAFVGHAFRASPRRARRVAPNDDLQAVGDDALVAARELAPFGIPVWVAPSRRVALDAALANGALAVVDGLLQAHPTRLFRSVLVVDAFNPWGSGRCPPAGDLRAPADALLRMCDEVISVRDSLAEAPSPFVPSPQHPERPVRSASIDLIGACDPCGNPVSLSDLRDARVGLASLMARPDRVLSTLLRRSVRPSCHWRGADHQTPTWLDLLTIRRLASRFRLDAWLVTPKCACHLDGLPVGAPVWTLVFRARLDPSPGAVLESRPCAPFVCYPSC